MPRSRFTEEQVVPVLAQGLRGGGIVAACRRLGISVAAYYR